MIPTPDPRRYWHGGSYDIVECMYTCHNTMLLPPNDVVNYVAPNHLIIARDDIVWVGIVGPEGDFGITTWEGRQEP